jgi:hypothetical protein
VQRLDEAVLQAHLGPNQNGLSLVLTNQTTEVLRGLIVTLTDIRNWYQPPGEDGTFVLMPEFHKNDTFVGRELANSLDIFPGRSVVVPFLTATVSRSHGRVEGKPSNDFLGRAVANALPRRGKYQAFFNIVDSSGAIRDVTLCFTFTLSEMPKPCAC